MAKAFKQVRSSDALTVIIAGDKRNPEPGTLIVKLPGGHVEVSRCSDGSYWVHLQVIDPTNIIASRIEYAHKPLAASVADMPDAERVNKLALRIANTVPHFDPDA